jgi:hypothetical protein
VSKGGVLELRRFPCPSLHVSHPSLLSVQQLTAKLGNWDPLAWGCCLRYIRLHYFAVSTGIEKVGYSYFLEVCELNSWTLLHITKEDERLATSLRRLLQEMVRKRDQSSGGPDDWHEGQKVEENRNDHWRGFVSC